MTDDLAHHWTLDPAIGFLNHGSFGATPRRVLEAQQAWRSEMEVEPVRFMVEKLEPALDGARAQLGAFVGADPGQLAFVPNATTGANTVLRSLAFEPGDEILTTDHEYNAIKNAIEFVAARSGARMVVAEVPFPSQGPDEVIERVMGDVTSRTRLAVLDHVTSATGLVLPVGQLVALLAERGIDTLIDGAHAPGMLELDVAAIGAAYYTGNLHKWVCAPKGAAFLWVRRDRQERIRPLTISHGANDPRTDRSRFRLEFDWTGTGDPSAFLAVPEALGFGSSLLDGGWPALRASNHALALAGRDVMLAALKADQAAPDEMIGSMASIPLGWERGSGAVQGVKLDDDALHAGLMAAGFQVMVTPWPQRPGDGPWRRVLRISAAAYNTLEQFQRLAAVLPGVARGAAGAPVTQPTAVAP
jgi:isopenicillin-N epimerase